MLRMNNCAPNKALQSDKIGRYAPNFAAERER